MPVTFSYEIVGEFVIVVADGRTEDGDLEEK